MTVILMVLVGTLRHAATTIANRSYETAVHQYMVYHDDEVRGRDAVATITQTTETEDEYGKIRDETGTDVSESRHVEGTDKIFHQCETTVERMLSASNYDESSEPLRSDVQVHRVLVSIRCLRDMHRVQRPPLDLDSWKAIADIVEEAEEANDLTLLPFPTSEISRLHLAVLKHMTLGKLFVAMRIGGPARLDGDGSVVAITNETGVQEITDNGNDSEGGPTLS